jgi:sugar diacid utilization regulator
LVDTSSFDYDLAGHHVGLIASGDHAEDAIRQLAANLDRRLLVVRPADEGVWGWIGGRRDFSDEDFRALTTAPALKSLPVALGEPSTGLAGWRLTHRQAKAAWPLALRREGHVRYSAVAILASLLQDDLLAASLRDCYLRPLEDDRDGGATARETLQAYFAAERNVSSAAADLKVSRRTVANRLRAIEGRLGQPLSSVGAEIEIALRLKALEDSEL